MYFSRVLNRARRSFLTGSLAVLLLFDASNCSGQEQIESHTVADKSETLKDRKGITFGMRQLEQMLADRPEMRDAVPPGHPVAAEIANCFDGRTTGQRVHWLGTSPPKGTVANHAQPYGRKPPSISITDSLKTTPIDKWALAVFEL